jgi:hypothetical protein
MNTSTVIADRTLERDAGIACVHDAIPAFLVADKVTREPEVWCDGQYIRRHRKMRTLVGFTAN